MNKELVREILISIIVLVIFFIVFCFLAKLFWAYAPEEIQRAFKNAVGIGG